MSSMQSVLKAAQHATERLVVKSALNPLLWLCTIPTTILLTTAFYFDHSDTLAGLLRASRIRCVRSGEPDRVRWDLPRPISTRQTPIRGIPTPPSSASPVATIIERNDASHKPG